MEIRLVIFLAFTAVTVVSNSVLIWLMYKAFGQITSQITDAAVEFEKSEQTRTWIASLQTASESAITVTEIARKTIADYDPMLEQAQAKYQFALAKADYQMECLASEISDHALCMRDAVALPAEKIAAIASGIQNVFGFAVPEDDDV